MYNDTPGLNLLCDCPGRSDGTSVFLWLFTVFDTSSKCEATTLLTHFISLCCENMHIVRRCFCCDNDGRPVC